jgi:hypothetical protein
VTQVRVAALSSRKQLQAQSDREHGRRADQVVSVPPSLREEIIMSASTADAATSTSVYTTRWFWERVWRMAGIQFLGTFIIGYFVYGSQPHIGASPDALAAFYLTAPTRGSCGRS